MASFFSFLTHKKIPSPSTFRSLLRGPLTLYRGLVYGVLIAAATIIFILIVTVHNSFLVTVPARGGTLVEGVIGAPKTINPILAMTDTDAALTRLVYAGLMKELGDGTIVPEIAESSVLSPDSRTYTVTLRPTKFHDGKPLTSKDVLFTVGKLQNSALNPSHTEYWRDVGVETPNEQTVVFTLPAPRTDFLNRLTIGILPEHVWAEIPDETFASARQNLHPIGAGAFKLVGVETNESIVSVLTLKRNHRYVLGSPLLKTLLIKIYANQEKLMSALNNGDVLLTAALLPQTLSTKTPSGYTVEEVPGSTEAVLYHMRGDRGALANAALVTVLSQYIDKEQIIAIVEHGFGAPLDTAAAPKNTIEEAHARLETLGYRLHNGTLMKNGTPVGFSIATINTPEALALARAFATEVRALGITVSVRNFDPGFFQSALAERSFSAVLIKGPAPSDDYEAILPLYRATTPFVLKTSAHGIIQNVLISPVLRYANVHQWYTNTDRLYPWLAQERLPKQPNY